MSKVWRYGDHIDTDVIIPARYLNIADFTELAEHAMEDAKENLVVGTIRSARHNFVDFALESDAIFCCFGWSHYAEADLKGGSIDYLQGLYGVPFYRNNPEKLASEHTAYTDFAKLKKSVESKGFRTTSDNSILLNYNLSDVDLSKTSEPKVANSVTIPYGNAPQIASFKYNKETKMYTRYENGVKCIDHNTKEEVTNKNIITYNVDYKKCDDNYYWDLDTIGSGEGYYITNGQSIKITWNKKERGSKTIIKNSKGEELKIDDGNTFIQIQPTSKTITIE